MPPADAMPDAPRVLASGDVPPPPPSTSGSTRRDPAVLMWAAALLLVIRIATGVMEQRHPPEVVDHILWQPIENAEAISRETHRPIFYDFTADWCPPCQAMKREVFGNEKTAKRINSMFVPVKVLDRAREQGSNAPEVTALQARFNVTAFPTLVIVPRTGRAPATIEGYPGRDELMTKLVEVQARIQIQSLHIGVPDTTKH